MPGRKSGHPPKYRHHKARNLAVVTIDGHDHYLGPYNSPESFEKYAVLIAQSDDGESDGSQPRQPSADEPVTPKAPLSIAALTLKYFKFAEGYYVKDGKPTQQVHRVKMAIRALNALYADTRADQFGPRKLREVQQYLVKRKDPRAKNGPKRLSRNYANSLIRCIVRMFKWAASEELVPVTVFQSLQTVEGLKKGRTEARETDRVQPVAEADIDNVLPHLGPQVSAMVQLQKLSGMRPGEVTIIRPCDIEQRTDVWLYRPNSHKNEHHDQERIIVLGPLAQAVLRPWLSRAADAFCFSPREAVQRRREDLRARRKSRVQPSQRNRAKSNPRVTPGETYSRGAYRTAIHRACDSAGIPPWSPNQLRHFCATRVRARFGLEASQVTIGNSKPDTTLIYAERDLNLAARVAREMG